MATKVNRTPGKHTVNPRLADEDGRECQYDTLITAWRKATHTQRSSTQVLKPASVGENGEEIPAETRRIRRWRRNEGTPGLRQFARQKAKEGWEPAVRWLHNKQINASKPPLGLGRTRKKKGDASGKKGKKLIDPTTAKKNGYGA